jgi:hypothetical protein
LEKYPLEITELNLHNVGRRKNQRFSRETFFNDRFPILPRIEMSAILTKDTSRIEPLENAKTLEKYQLEITELILHNVG